jgi:uncharacterized protein YbdZ (MbtH family)
MNINEYYHDYFSELRTIPSGWDLSGMGETLTATGGDALTPLESAWQSIKFREPRTIPGGWDLSGMV